MEVIVTTQGHSKEAVKERVELKYAEALPFELFVQWIYCGDFNQAAGRHCNDAFANAQAQVLGDRIDAIHFKNYYMNKIYERHIPTDLVEAGGRVGKVRGGAVGASRACTVAFVLESIYKHM